MILKGETRPVETEWGRGGWRWPGQRWRVGSEDRISVLKRGHRLDRRRYRGLAGMERWVGLGVIANNLVTIATAAGWPAG